MTRSRRVLQARFERLREAHLTRGKGQKKSRKQENEDQTFGALALAPVIVTILLLFGSAANCRARQMSQAAHIATIVSNQGGVSCL
jgi:hypothetical protein